MSEFSVEKAKQEAESELQKERGENAKKQIKSKLREISDAKIIVANLERELGDIERELAAGI